MQSKRGNGTPWSRCPYRYLPVWLVAEQSYCEKRVELWLQDPGERVSVPKQLEGTPMASLQETIALAGKQAHLRMSAPAIPVPVPPAALVPKLGTVDLIESPLPASFDGLPVLGIPDAVSFEEGKPTAIIDYKFRNSPRPQLQPGDRVQLYLYGYLVEESGFEAADLLLACVLAPAGAGRQLPKPETGTFTTIRDSVRRAANRAPKKRGWRVDGLKLPGGIPVTVRSFRYERSKAESELGFAANFWHGRRAAKPTSNRRKCAVCLYNFIGSCPVALVPFRGPGPARP